MSTDLVTGLAGGVRTGRRGRASHMAPPDAGTRRRATPLTPEAPDEMMRAQADRRHALRHTAKTVVAWGLRSLLASIALVIVWIWLRGGNVTNVHTPADLLTSIGRITGLFGAYLLLLQVLLLARLPFLEWVVGFDRLTRWHRLNGKLCLALILAHLATIVTGYALTCDRLVRSFLQSRCRSHSRTRRAGSGRSPESSRPGSH